jgi:NADH-quinone oxidoreductase subunit C/D
MTREMIRINAELSLYKPVWDRDVVFISVELDQLQSLLLLSKEDLRFLVLSNITVRHERENFILSYSLQNYEENLSLNIDVNCPEFDSMISVRGLWEYAFAFEREIFELYGLKFDSITTSERYLFADNIKGFPFRHDFKGFSFDGKIKKNLKKQFNDTPCFKLCSDDISFHYNIQENRITDFAFEMGYKHIGFEKDAEGRDLTEMPHRLSYLNNVTPHFWSYSYCHLIETHYSIDIPEKAQGIRMVVAELSRIKDHLYSLLKLCFSLKYFDYITNLTFWYERITDQLRSLTSQMNISYLNIIGGVKFDIPSGWTTSCLELLNKLEKEISIEYSHFSRSSYFFDKLNCGEISKQFAVSRGLSGPLLRSTGYNLDLRKTAPHYFYKDISFDVPLGIKGSVYDRFLILNEEIFQSIKILFQLIDNLPGGELGVSDIAKIIAAKQVDDPKLCHLVGQGFESPRGILYLNSMVKSGKVLKLKLESASQQALGILPELMNGEHIENKELIWNSLLVNMSEVER